MPVRKLICQQSPPAATPILLCAALLCAAALTANAQQPQATEPAPAAPATGPLDVPPPSPKPTGTLVPAQPTSREQHERAVREALAKMPLEKRRQVLEAMKKVWADDDVRGAREELRRATESYRRTLRTAMEETDPEVRTAVRPLLDRLLRAGLTPDAWHDSPDARPLANSPLADGPPRYLRLLGLVGEKAASLTPEDRRLLSSVRDRVMADERILQAAATLTATKGDPPRARAQAMQELRRVTRAVAIELEPRLQPLLEKPSPPAASPR